MDYQLNLWMVGERLQSAPFRYQRGPWIQWLLRQYEEQRQGIAEGIVEAEEYANGAR